MVRTDGKIVGAIQKSDGLTLVIMKDEILCVTEYIKQSKQKVNKIVLKVSLSRFSTCFVLSQCRSFM